MNSKSLVYKANALVEASYRLSLYEQRIVLACIAQVRHDEPLTDQQLYMVSAQQIADIAGVGLKTAYRHLKEASERLFDRRVMLHEAPNGKGSGKVRLTRWVQTVEYREAEGMVALRFGTDMVPYLSQLTAQFTRYALGDVAKMTSAHAIRLYELLSQWREVREREVSVEWLREALLLEDCYDRIPDLKRWVLLPAIEQINKHSPLWVKWDQRKTGRRVSHLIFSFGEKPANSSVKARKNTSRMGENISGAVCGIPKAIIEAKARTGESYEEVALRLLEEAKRSRR